MDKHSDEGSMSLEPADGWSNAVSTVTKAAAVTDAHIDKAEGVMLALSIAVSQEKEMQRHMRKTSSAQLKRNSGCQSCLAVEGTACQDHHGFF